NTERKFTQQPIGTLASTAIPQIAHATPFAPEFQSATQPTSWYDRPMRWAQLTLVEDDPGKYDPAFWLDYFRRTHSDAACLSAGGCVAFYPTRGPFHYRSKYLRDLHFFRAPVTCCP